MNDVEMNYLLLLAEGAPQNLKFQIHRLRTEYLDSRLEIERLAEALEKRQQALQDLLHE